FIMVSTLISVVINFFKSTYQNFLDDLDLRNRALVISERISREEKKKAEEANNAKKDFLSVMSHEIRTPLNAIISVINLLDEKKDEIKNVEYITTLKDSSESLLSLVSDILDFSKIESGEIKIEEREFDLKKIVESIVNVYKIQAEKRNNLLSYSFEGFYNYDFIGDSLRINQIFNNLVSNAIKFTENGTINLKISFIEDDFVKKSTKILFEVTDTGIGVPADKLDYIFEKFTQENFSITRKYGGSGLGLSITKKLIELMNGNIKLESIVGIGSRFYFYLDLKKSDKKEDYNLKKEPDDLSKIKVLLVEDNDVNIMLTTKFFDKWKLNYQVAENGLIALDKFRTNKFDLILMDLQMPEMDGFTATQEIRKENINIPIIALTANSMSEEREKCLSSGFNYYITKPFKPNYLKEKILFYFNLNK
ncbi:MAG: response regulator, partial [Candidatus Sericytochromatia bacterium]